MDKIRAVFTIFHMVITVTIAIIVMYLFKNTIRPVRVFWAKMQLKLLGIKLEITGTEAKEADMLLINHQSILDIVVLESLSAKNLAWVAKKEIGDIPWFGQILKVPNMIMVERESKSSLVKLIKDCKDRLDDGRKIAIFPEGTRTDGKKIRKFKAGSKIIAQKYNLTVQPVVVIGSIDVWDSKKFIQKSGIVKVIFLDPVKADKSTSWYEDIEENMKKTLEEGLKK
jgi:1-acyl-sn-glycerol-3-phosphate acyltransferase